MAISVRDEQGNATNLRIRDIVLDASYSNPAGYPMGGSVAGYVPMVDPASGNLRVFRSAGAAGALQEVPNATDLSAVVIRALTQ